jgi:hypothetical protein
MRRPDGCGPSASVIETPPWDLQVQTLAAGAWEVAMKMLRVG